MPKVVKQKLKMFYAVLRIDVEDRNNLVALGDIKLNKAPDECFRIISTHVNDEILCSITKTIFHILTMNKKISKVQYVKKNCFISSLKVFKTNIFKYHIWRICGM